MTYLPFDDEATTIAEFIAGLLPQLEEPAAATGWDKAVLARVTAVRLYKQGWRTSTLPGGVRIATKVDRPIPCPDDDPPPGMEQDRAA